MDRPGAQRVFPAESFPRARRGSPIKQDIPIEDCTHMTTGFADPSDDDIDWAALRQECDRRLIGLLGHLGPLDRAMARAISALNNEN